jgi:hypothetical protein
MKRILLIALAMIAIIGCSKKDDEKPAFTQEQMEGRWKWVDSRLPDGKLFSQLLPQQEYQSRLNKSFIALRGNTASITDEKGTLSATYKLIGKTIQISVNGKTLNMFDIVKGSQEKVELKYHNDFKKEIKVRSYGQSSGIPGYSADQVLDAVLMYDKAD